MLGISTSSFYGKLNTDDAIYKIAESGVKCAEVFLNTFSEYTEDYISLISDRLNENGLLFNSVHTLPTQFEPQLFAVSNRQKKDAYAFFERVISTASKGGCKIYVMHGKPYFKKNTGNVYFSAKSVAKDLNEACCIAQRYGMVIALENVHWAMCNNFEFINEVKELCPQLKFTLDVKQAHLAKSNYREYINAFGERLVNVHICDYDGVKTRIVGQGELSLEDLKNCLNEANYKGNVIIEVYGQDYKSFDELFKCVSYCKNYF